MKSSFFIAMAVVALTPIAIRAAVVSESDAEFFASGDFDGDGRLDTVVVDRATGTYRLGYQSTPEALTWWGPRITGIDDASGVAVGRFFNATRDALAATSPDANRIALVAPVTPAVEATPVEVFPDVLGPAVLAGVDLPGVGPGNDPALDDVFIGARFGSMFGVPTAPDVIGEIRPTGVPILLAPFAVAAPLHRANPVLLKTGLQKMAAVMVGTDTTPGEFHVYAPSSDPPSAVFTIPGVEAGSAFVVERFAAANPLAQVLIYRPGTPQLRLRPVTEPAVGDLVPGAESTFTLPAPISQVVVLADPAGPRLLVLFNDGGSAAIYTFNGVAAPVAVLSVVAPAGRRFASAAALGNGHFILGSGAASLRRTEAFHRYHREAAGGYTAAQTGSLPLVGTHSGRSNVLFFALEPFVADNPKLLGSRRTPDWATSFNLQATSVQQESFLGGATGLSAPQTVPLAPLPAGTQYILPNQFRADASVLSFRGPSAAEVNDVTISPPPGFYQAAVAVTLAPRDPLRQVYFRLGPAQPWTLYGGPITVALDAVLDYYSQAPATSARSALFSADYRFPDGGLAADADADGVPDFVELARGLDVQSGRDADGDGVADLQELLANTDPKNPASFPAVAPPPPGAPGFDLTVSPAFYSAFTPQPGWRLTDVPIEARRTAGGLLAVENAMYYLVPPGVTVSQARLVGLHPPAAPFFSVSSPPQFAIGNVNRAGAELATLVTPPAPASGGLDYLPEGRALTDEAAAWVAALQGLAAASTPSTASVTLSPIETLVALLVEAKLRLILTQRAVAGAANADLFPFRSATAATHAIPPAVLASLTLPDAANHPAYDVAGLLARVRSVVPGAADGASQNLRAMAIDVYQTFENSLPENSPGATPLHTAPIDTLRSFLAGTPLPADYLAASGLTAPQRTSAAAAAQSVLASLTPRPQAIRLLDVQADSFGPLATVLPDSSTAQRVALLEPTGRPWRFAGAVAPPAGSRLRVTGFSDVTVPVALAPSALAVLAVEIISFPPAPPDDSDGDGLSDAWEHALLGGLSAQPGADPDGDGATNAQEFAAGTDPNDECSAPAIVAPLLIPVLEKNHQADGKILLFWDYPLHLVASVTFTLETSGDLQVWLPMATPVTQPTPGRFNALVTPGPTSPRFYRLRVTAR